MGRVFVVGSLNTDLVLSVDRCPHPGETVLASAVTSGCGGKGANQAVAAARAGATVTMVGCVGTDPGGDQLLAALSAAGIDTSRVARVAGDTGLAVVTVGADGENEIVVAPGANRATDPGMVRSGLSGLTAADVVLAQAEIPVPAIRATAQAAAGAGARFVLNLAPPSAAALDVPSLHTLVVNQHEAAVIQGAAGSPEQLAGALAERCAARVVVTLGSDGVVLAGDGPTRRIDAYPATRVVDTTGAGDAFAGALAAALADGATLDDAARLGAAAGALTVAAVGAQGAVDTTPAALRAIIAGGSRRP